MGSHVRNVLGKDIASIVGKYLLPDKDKMKKLYSSIITDKSNLSYENPSIMTQYFYIKLHQDHKIGYIKCIYGNIYHIKFIVPNRNNIINRQQPPFDNEL